MKKENNQLNHDFIIEYEDGIDKNEEINYEGEDINNQYNFEKENELIKKGINPYTNEIVSKTKNGEWNKNEAIFENKKKDENLDNYNKRNIRRKNVNVVYLKEKRKIDRKSLLRKVNDYTFNISINNNSKNIFTENHSKNKNIQNEKDKKLLDNKDRNDNNNNKIKKGANSIKNYMLNEKDENVNEEIITYKISSISKNKLEELSKTMTNQKEIQKENIFPNYNSNILIRSNEYNRNFVSKEKKNKNDNCLTNNDEKNHNFISIINITNNAPMQNKQMTIGDEEKVYDVDNCDNEVNDELKINTLKINDNILNENKTFDINNNDYFLEKDNKEKSNNLIRHKSNNNALKKHSQNTKNSLKIDLPKIINNNSELDNINEKSLKSKHLTLNLASFNNYKTTKINNSNIPSLNQKDSNNNNKLSPIKRFKNENKSEFFNNLNSSTLKITKTKEVNIKELKNNKLNILNKKKFSKTINSNNKTQKSKLISNSRDKIHLIKPKINTNRIIVKNDSKEKMINVRGFHLSKINKNNLSWDNFEFEKNKAKKLSKLSPKVIEKLKQINLPISKNQIVKTESNADKYKDSLNKKNKYSFYQYINSINFDNKYISMTKQSICYYRIYKRKNEKINLSEMSINNLEKIGFSKGYISIILKSDLLQFIPKINNNNEITIILKNIIGVQIEQYMQNIINKLYNSEQPKENIEINNIIFEFNLLISDFQEGKIECIFDNFEIFMFWMKFLEEISEYYRNSDYDLKIKFD